MVKITLKKSLNFFLSILYAILYYVLDIPRLINIPFNYLQDKVVDLNNNINKEMLAEHLKIDPSEVIYDVQNVAGQETDERNG